MTRSSGRAPARARLADLMDARRRDLRLTWDEVATRAGINRETLRQIRNGNGDIRPLSKTGIEDALEWERGSVDAILAGSEPTPIEPRHVALSDQGTAGDVLSRTPSVEELAKRLERLERSQERHRQENNELRKMLREITGKPSSTSGGREPGTEAPREAM